MAQRRRDITITSKRKREQRWGGTQIKNGTRKVV